MHIKSQSAGAAAPDDQINDLELQCLGFLARGRSIGELCEALSLTETQAQDILGGVEGKLGALNRMHAVILAIRLGMLDEAD